MNEVISILMDRDDMDYEDAVEELDLMRQAVLDGQDPEEVLYEYGLEPDYIWEILP